jgi:hypothetical protein
MYSDYFLSIHFELSSAISNMVADEVSQVALGVFENQGSLGLYQLSKSLSEEFVKLNPKGEFDIELLEKFINEKLISDEEISAE